jgi:hypothetical protein
VPSTSFEHPSVHPQEDLHKQFYGICLMHSYKPYGLWQGVLDAKVYSTLREGVAV